MERSAVAKAADTIKKTTISKEACAGGILGLMGLFCGAFTTAGSLNPVGIAYIMASLGEGAQFYIAVLTVIAGFILGGQKTFASDYAIAVLLCAFYGLVRDRSNKTVYTAEKAASAFGIFVISGLIKGLIESDIVYILMVYALEGLVIFSLVYIFDKGIASIKSAVTKRSIDRSGAAGLAAVGAFAVCGAAEIYQGVLPLHIILGFYMILICGWMFGTDTAAASGILTGFALLLGGMIDTKMFVIMGISAVAAGAFSGGGRILTALGCISVSVMAAYYFRLLEPSFVLSVAASCLMFVISAERISKAVSITDVGNVRATEEHYAADRSYITGRLMDCCRSIDALYKTLTPKASKEKGKKETDDLVDKVACMACENCPMVERCWNNSFYNTYQTLLTLFSDCEKKGKVNADDLPNVFRDYCVKQEEFTEAVNVTYTAHRERLIWKMRLNESKQIACEQLSAMADMMKNLAEEFTNRAGFKENLEKILLYELRRTNDNVERVTVEESENGQYRVAVYKHGCEGRQDCRDKTIETVSSILGRKMRRSEKDCEPDANGRCRLVLCEKCGFKISVGAAMAIKDNERVSGDSYSFMELPKGGYMIALSDGMGSGRAAGEESRTVIELLEQFAEAGFKRELALKLINSVLVLGTDAESFATLDMCCIDMYTGSAEFIKTGAAATFLIRDGKAKAIRSSSLPIGMLKYFDMDRTEYKLKKNDIILMLTDGAAEVIDRDSMSDIILTELMKNNKMKDPKDIADYVLESLKERSGFRIQDDMTVVAARIWG
ncbi:MAG: stage II sporulation protein E [Clostridiales bacterium]|nr:stage II sporulation protein E [Clostridiales bacterium]